MKLPPLYKALTPRYQWILYELDGYEPKGTEPNGALFPLPSNDSIKKWVADHEEQYPRGLSAKTVIETYIAVKMHSLGIEYEGIAQFHDHNRRVYRSKSKGDTYTLSVDKGWVCKREIPNGIEVISRKTIFMMARQCGKTKFYGDMIEGLMERIEGI